MALGGEYSCSRARQFNFCTIKSSLSLSLSHGYPECESSRKLFKLATRLESLRLEATSLLHSHITSRLFTVAYMLTVIFNKSLKMNTTKKVILRFIIQNL